MDSTFGERLQQVIDAVARSQRDFARQLDENAANVNNYTRDTKPSVDFLAKVATTFPEINIRWLVVGEGEMRERKEAPAREQAPKNMFEMLRGFVKYGVNPDDLKLTTTIEGSDLHIHIEGRIRRFLDQDPDTPY